MTFRRILNLGKNHQWVLKAAGDRLLRKGIFTHLRVSLPRLLTTYKEEKVPSQWKGLADMTFTKWLNSARPLMGQTDILCLLSCDAAGGTQHHLGINLAKKYLTNSNHEETTRQNQVVKHKTADIYCSKMSTPWETKRSWRNCSRLKENKDYEFSGWSLIGSWWVLLRLQCMCESLGDLTKLIHCVRNGPWESAFLMSSQVTPVLQIQC